MRQLAGPLRNFEADPDRPDVPRLQRTFLSDDAPFVPGGAAGTDGWQIFNRHDGSSDPPIHRARHVVGIAPTAHHGADLRRRSSWGPLRRVLRRVPRSASYLFRSKARKRLIVTGVTPKKEAINEWVKMSS